MSRRRASSQPIPCDLSALAKAYEAWERTVPDWSHWWENGDHSQLVAVSREAWRVAKAMPNRRRKSLGAQWPLPYEPIPGNLGGEDLSNTSPRLFRALRDYLKSTGQAASCQACARQPEATGPLHAHEEWHWNDRTYVRTLTGIRFLCRDCHYLSHQAWAAFLPIPLKKQYAYIVHFCQVNHCQYVDAIAHADYTQSLSDRRSKATWKIDRTPLFHSLL